MANYVVKVGKDFYDLSRPVVRKELFERVDKELDVTAFKLLYNLYFSDIYKEEFHERELSAMCEVVLSLIDRVLNKHRNADWSRAAAFLEASVPILRTSELFQLDSIVAKIDQAIMSERDQDTISSLNKVRAAIEERYKKAQAESEPE